MKKNYRDVDWSKGVPRAWLKDEWKKPLIVLQRYMNCEGRYNLTFTYHIRILQHFAQGKEMDFPYFLWKLLKKMCKTIKKLVVSLEQHLFRHRLIKLLIVAKLRGCKDTWDSFIAKMFPSPVVDPLVSIKIENSLFQIGNKGKVKNTGEVSSLKPEFKRITRSMTSKQPRPDNHSLGFQMKLCIDTDEEMGEYSSTVAEALVNLKEDMPPNSSQPSSPP